MPNEMGTSELLEHVDSLNREHQNILSTLQNEVSEIERQLQTLQGQGGLLEPLSLISAYDATGAYTNANAYTFVGEAALLASGQGIVFSRPANLPYLIIEAIGGGADCMFTRLVSGCWATEVAAGRGIEGQAFSALTGCTFNVYSTPFGAAGAITAANTAATAAGATGSNEVIFICGGTYTATATQSVAPDAYSTFRIVGAGPQAVTLAISSSSSTIFSLANVGVGQQVIIENLEFDLITGAGTVNVGVGFSGSSVRGILKDCNFLTDTGHFGVQTDTSAANFHILDNFFQGGGTHIGTPGGAVFGATILGNTFEQATVAIDCANTAMYTISGNDFIGCTTGIQFSGNSSSTDTIITGNRFDSCTKGIDALTGTNIQFNTVIADNIFLVGNGEIGIDFSSMSGGGLIFGWQIGPNTFRATHSSAKGIIGDASFTVNQITDNVFKGFTSGNEISGLAATTVSAHNISVDNSGVAQLIADNGSPVGHTGAGTGGAAPNNAQYLTLAADATLTAERVFTPRYNLYVTDGGAGAAYSVDSWREGALITQSGTVLTLGTDGDMFHVGAGDFATIATPTRQTLALLIFDGVSVLTHGANLILQGAANFTSAAGDVLLMAWEGGTVWREVNRHTAAAASGSALTVQEEDGAPIDTAVTIIRFPNGSVTDNGVGDVSIAFGGGAAHALLDGSTHNDTLIDTVTDGDIIIGNVTPKWSSLAISIPAATFTNILGVFNGELRPSWKTLQDDAVDTVAVSTAAGDGTAISLARKDHVHAHEAAHINHDTTWAARGDLIIGTANDTAAITTLGASGTILRSDGTDASWATLATGGIAPNDVDYLVGTASGALTNEIVVGTTPGGELGGTWAAPTVDAVHSGSAHHSAITLGADTDTILSLTGQQIDLDPQAANLVFAGPTSGGAVDPSFRSLVSADLPASVVETTDADWIDLTDGGATTLHSHAGGSSIAIYTNGVLQLSAVASFNFIDYDADNPITVSSTQALVHLENYASLLGRDDGQLFYGGVNEYESLVFSSTADPQKGFIYFGLEEDERMAFDEENVRLGIGTDEPTATLDVFGDVKISGSITAPIKQTLLLQGWQPTTTSGCATAATSEIGSTTKHDFFGCAFDSTSAENAFLHHPMPDNWDGGTVKFRVWWLCLTGYVVSSSDGVAWTLKGTSYSDGQAVDSVFGSGVTVTDVGTANNTLNVTPESTALTIAGAGAGELIHWVLTRAVSDAADDWAADAYPYAVVVEYGVTTLSS